MSKVQFYDMKTGEVLLESDSIDFNTDIKYKPDIPKMPVDLRLQGTIQIKDAKIDVDWLVTMVSMFVTDEKKYRRLTHKLVGCKNRRKHKKLQKRILKLFNTF